MNADVFLLTSLWEGLPISLLESMYMKKLCIVHNVIGNRDVIQNGVNGFVCKSVKEFVKGIEIGKKGLVQQYVEYAFKDILEQYNVDVQSEAYSKIYYHMLNNR